MVDCSFCNIVSGKENSFTVFENDLFLAFLDKRPLFKGHILLIPKSHIVTLTEMPEKIIGPFFKTVQMLTIAVEKSMLSEGSFIALNNRVSQSVPHLHVHIVPRTKGDGLKGFFWPRKKYSDDTEMKDVREKIKNAVAGFNFSAD